MSIDISTLVLLTIVVSCGLGAMFVALPIRQSGMRGSQGTRHWGHGLVGMGLAYALLYLYPNTGPVMLFAGWVLLLFSILAMSRALLRIHGSGEHRTRFSIAVIGAAAVGWLFFGFVAPNPIRQMDVTSLAIAVIAGRAAWDVWRFSRDSTFRAPALLVTGFLLLTASRPLLEFVARDVHAGALDPMALFGPPGVVFFRVLVLTLLSISVLWLAISRAYDAVELQATQDELTGVANRRAIVVLLERELARARRENLPCCVALLDIDFFKHVNDTLGHPAGDQVLRWVTGVIGQSIRPYDTLARFGGEEFLLLMPGTGTDGGAAVAERVRRAIEGQDCIFDDKPIHITISAGVAAWSKGVDSDALLRSADHVLYEAKQGGRNRVVRAESTKSRILATGTRATM